MSVQFGRWNFNGEPVDTAYRKAVRSLLVPYAPDGIAEESAGSVTLLFGSFHMTKESRQEQQPGTSPKATGSCGTAASTIARIASWISRSPHRNSLTLKS